MAAVMGDRPRLTQKQNDLVEIDEIKRISISDLVFSVTLPDGSVQKVLDDFSFEFSDPGTYCIVGENGRGKTSLLYLILGLYTSEGKVRYNNIPIEKCNLDYIRAEAISCCPQACFAPDLPSSRARGRKRFLISGVT